jgi:hypothetical protein
MEIREMQLGVDEEGGFDKADQKAIHKTGTIVKVVMPGRVPGVATVTVEVKKTINDKGSGTR